MGRCVQQGLGRYLLLLNRTWLNVPFVLVVGMVVATSLDFVYATPRRIGQGKSIPLSNSILTHDFR